MSAPSPLDGLLEEMERALHAKKRDLEGVLGPLEGALASYRLALEHELAQEFASSHSLPRPRGAVVSRAAAAARLFELVRSLPELARESSDAPGKARGALDGTSSGQEREASAPPAPGAPLRENRAHSNGFTTGAPSSEEATFDQLELGLKKKLPRLVAAVARGRIVVVGSFAGRKKELPALLEAHTEWIDTARDGVHAIGNLPQRIRQGRVVAVIVCDRAIGHQHAEPLVHAARASHVPVGFAGKGGSLGLARALESIEGQLVPSAP